MRDAREKGMNWSQVRERIDRGETGDKRAAADPALTALGTDAEAGGSSTERAHAARSAAAEDAGPAARAAAQGRAARKPRRALLRLALGAAAVVGLALTVALALAL